MLPTLTCTKEYRDIPFAHRQPNHSGHCAMIHGHNWTFRFTFGAANRDACGFVIDFGGIEMKNLKAWLDAMFDHRLVLNEDDPYVALLKEALVGNFDAAPIAMITLIPDCSCEGIAQWVFSAVNAFMHADTKGRVWLKELTVFEDSKNSATATA